MVKEQGLLYRLHLDGPLLVALLLVCALSLVVLYSASGADPRTVTAHGVRIVIGLVALVVLAQIHPMSLGRWSPWLYAVGLVLLVLTLFIGEGPRGVRSWLDLGPLRFQPSELMKTVTPVLVAFHLCRQPVPPRLLPALAALLMVLLPVVLIERQPDLGTAALLGAAGLYVIFFAGLAWRYILGALGLGLAALPLLWFNMREYQRERVMALLDPQSDPLGSGYHIIQSTIAVGSGGLYGKGWLNGTQSHLDFLPERHTDFIFAVFCEEFGLIGVLGLLLVYAFIIARGLYIALEAQDMYSRMLAGALTMVFFTYAFVNIGMVIGQLPVVGVPLPLMSYGGTSLVTLLAGFGILMSIHTHRRLLAH